MAAWLDAAAATWEECRDYLAAHSCAILPMGATEQHGPHLPQNTDTLLAQAAAAGVAHRTCGLLLPAQPVGYSWVWRDFPGSLTFSFDTLRAVVQDLAESLARGGCRSLLIVHGHGANPNPVKYAIREVADELELTEVWRGLRPCSPDGLPYLGRVRDCENLTVAAGHAMIGVSLGPVTGDITARLVQREDPGFDLGLCQVERFA